MNIAHRLTSLLLAASLLALGGCAATTTHEGTGEYIDDSVVTAKVKASIFNEPSLKSSEINVETFKGEVQLSGFVADPGDVQRAVDVARNVQGVKTVVNDIHVK